MDTQNALVSAQEQDGQVIGAWLFGKSPHTQRAYSRIAWDMLDQTGKPLRGVTLFDVQGFLVYPYCIFFIFN